MREEMEAKRDHAKVDKLELLHQANRRAGRDKYKTLKNVRAGAHICCYAANGFMFPQVTRSVAWTNSRTCEGVHCNRTVRAMLQIYRTFPSPHVSRTVSIPSQQIRHSYVPETVYFSYSLNSPVHSIKLENSVRLTLILSSMQFS